MGDDTIQCSETQVIIHDNRRLLKSPEIQITMITKAIKKIIEAVNFFYTLMRRVPKRIL